jgi:hypothetical protein
MSQDYDYEFSNFDKGYTIHNNRAFTGGLIKDAGLYQLWAYLLHAANWKEGRLRNGETILQGQVVIGTEKLAKELESGLKNGQKTTRRIIQTRLEKLRKLNLIDTKTVHRGLLVTVFHYPTYELVNEESVQERCRNGAGTVQEPCTEEDKGKQRRPKKKKDPPPAGKTASCPGSRERFDRFWVAYPRRNGVKIGKEESKEVFDRLSAEDQELAIKAVEVYASMQGPDNQYTRDAFRFLRKDHWRGYLDVQATKPRSRVFSGTEEELRAFYADPDNFKSIGSTREDKYRYD